MKISEISRFDAAEYLTTPDEQMAFLAEAFLTDDPPYIAKALGIVARARGITDLAQATGLTRAGLYKALGSKGDPRLSTLMAVTKALGLHLTVAA